MAREGKEILAELKNLVKQHGTQIDAAKSIAVAPSYLNDLLQGRRPISDKIAKKFGYEWRLMKIDPLPPS